MGYCAEGKSFESPVRGGEVCLVAPPAAAVFFFLDFFFFFFVAPVCISCALLRTCLLRL